MSRILTCRRCGKTFSASQEEENITWKMRSKNYYYHMSCWEDFLNERKEKNDEEWKDLSYYIITHLLKESYNYHQIAAQFKKFQGEGMTSKGIYYALYWHFVVKESPWKSQFGIGLIPYIYEESKAYWYDQEEKRQGIMQQIERNTREQNEEARIIKQRPRRTGVRLKEVESPF